MARGWTAMVARGVAALILLGSVGIGVSLWHRVGPGASATAQPVFRSTVTVVPGVHVLGALSPSAAYVVETGDGLILVDSGLAPDAGPLKAEMAKLGLDWRRVRVILLTHAHGDHTGGAQGLRAQTGARVYAGAGDAAVLRAGGPREAFFSTFHMPDAAIHPTAVDVELRGGETIAVGDVRVHAIAAPGHTPGSIGYLADCRGLRVFFAGDVIMMLRGDDPPRDELDKPLGTYSAYLPPYYRGDARDTLATLRRLRELPVPDLVLPGHPGAQRNPEDPRLSPDRWRSLLDAGIRDMGTLIARYEADGADFLDGQPRRLLPDLYYLGDRDGRAVYGFFADSRLYLVDAPGGPGLSRFVSDRLRSLGRDPQPPAAVLLTACGADATSGLRPLLEADHPSVVAASAGIAGLRETLPPGTEIVPADELPGKGWFRVATVPLSGRGVAPVAYRLDWHGKAVLFSGQIPARISQESGQALIADLTRPPGDVREYVASLTRLFQAGRPDLWLPAVPIHGQNANLYDNRWALDLEENLGVVRAVVTSRPRS